MKEQLTVKHNIFWIVVTFMFASFCIFYSYTWGKYILLACAVFVFVFGYMLKYGLKDICIRPFHIFFAVFIAYCYITSLWAWDIDSVFVGSFTLLQILLCYSLLYCYYEKQTSIDTLLDCVRWGGYIVAIYSFFAYGGFEGIAEAALSGDRLDNTFNNVNTIAMLCAISCILEFHRLVYRTFSLSAFFTVPCIVMMATLQSRKAIIMLAVGVTVISILKNFNSKKITKSILKIVFIVVIIAIILSLLLSMNIFDGLNERLLSAVGDETTKDGSTALREEFIELGWEQFLKTPFGGIGIGGSRILTYKAMYRGTYLHNNYIELLACGGIFGFLLYYSIHIYLIFNLLKYYKYDKQRNIICITLLITMLIIDYAMVSYYDKASYFYYMIFFLQVEKVKKISRE